MVSQFISVYEAGVVSVLLLSFGSLAVSPIPFWLPISETQHAVARTALKWLSAFSVGWIVNAAASRWAENKWLLRRDPVAWDWPNEVAVVTGGSNGLGARLVNKLVAHGLKVAVLDVQPLSSEIKCGRSSTTEAHGGYIGANSL